MNHAMMQSLSILFSLKSASSAVSLVGYPIPYFWKNFLLTLIATIFYTHSDTCEVAGDFLCAAGVKS